MTNFLLRGSLAQASIFIQGSGRKNWIFSGLILTVLVVGVQKYRKWKKSSEIKKKNREAAHRRLIVITGCDSGLGLTMTKWAFDEGYSVLSGCLNDQSEGAVFLKNVEPSDETNVRNVRHQRITVKSLNVTQRESIQEFLHEAEKLLENYDLYALILNAAVMIPGEFFWETENQMKRQMDVNFWGAVNVVNVFQPILLQYQSRVIVISSDCAEYPLPGLSVYSATKSALESWTKAFRLEVAKYGVSVISFHPGSFPTKSRILCGQEMHAEEMKSAMDKKLLEFYGDTFDKFHSHYIQNFDKSLPPIQPVIDESLQNSFVTILESDIQLSPVFKYEDVGQKIFHCLINRLPQSLSDQFILKAMNSPPWTAQNKDFSNFISHSTEATEHYYEK